MGDVVGLGKIGVDLHPDFILNKALGELDNVVVIGFDKDGELYFASSDSGGGDVLWLLKKAEKLLLDYEGE